MLTRLRRIDHTTLLCMLLWCLVCLCAYYFGWRLQEQEKYGFHDWYLFIGHAKSFLATGVLYDRDLTHYGPAAAIYKFPPLFVSVLVVLVQWGYSEEGIRVAMALVAIFCYFFAVIALLLPLPAKKPWLLPAALLLALTFEPFFDTYDSAQMEMYILLLLSLSLVCLLKAKTGLSGVFVGIAAAIKIYPLYFAGYYLASKKYSALFGMLLGILLTLLFSLAVIGWPEHQFYFYNIMPTLLAEPVSGRGDNLSLARLLIYIGVTAKMAEGVNLCVLLLPVFILFYQKTVRAKPTTAFVDTMHFAIFIAIFLLATKNSWWNYQVLLIPPVLLIMHAALADKKIAHLPLAFISFAGLLIFWCNLGKMMPLVVFFSWVLDTLPFLNAIMLKIYLLRGVATFLILSALLYILYCRVPTNFFLVENKSST